MNVLSNVKNTIKYWWIYLIIGVLFIAGGLYVFSDPSVSYVSLSFFFSIIILMDGVGGIIFSLSNRDTLQGWGWQLASGIISTFIGFSLIMQPELSLVVLPIFVGFWILLKGSFIIGASFDLKKLKVSNWGWSLVLGILTSFLGLGMILNPVLGATMVLSFTAIAFLMMGSAIIFLAFKLKKIKSEIEHIKESGNDRLQELKTSIENYMNDESADLKGVLSDIKKKVDDAMN